MRVIVFAIVFWCVGANSRAANGELANAERGGHLGTGDRAARAILDPKSARCLSFRRCPSPELNKIFILFNSLP